MNCNSCKKEIDFESMQVKATPAAHDPKSLDVIATCECGQRYNQFIELSYMVPL